MGQTQLSYMNPQEFIDGGFLHEVNRLLLHPVGLALQITTPAGAMDGRFEAAIWDCREDPEGVYFDEGTLNAAKAGAVCEEMFKRRAERIKQLGWMVQPIRERRVLVTNYSDPSDAVSDPTHDAIEFEQ